MNGKKERRVSVSFRVSELEYAPLHVPRPHSGFFTLTLLLEGQREKRLARAAEAASLAVGSHEAARSFAKPNPQFPQAARADVRHVAFSELPALTQAVFSCALPRKVFENAFFLYLKY